MVDVFGEDADDDAEDHCHDDEKRQKSVEPTQPTEDGYRSKCNGQKKSREMISKDALFAVEEEKRASATSDRASGTPPSSGTTRSECTDGSLLLCAGLATALSIM
jgi:hypothetical protein